jgi:hypothetical protein
MKRLVIPPQAPERNTPVRRTKDKIHGRMDFPEFLERKRRGTQEERKIEKWDGFAKFPFIGRGFRRFNNTRTEAEIAIPKLRNSLTLLSADRNFAIMYRNRKSRIKTISSNPLLTSGALYNEKKEKNRNRRIRKTNLSLKR